MLEDSHRIGSPDDKRDASNGDEEGADLVAPRLSLCAAVDCQMPDDHEVSHASNSVPTPLLGCALATECRKEASQNHDNIRNDGHEDMGTIETGQQAEIEEQEGCRDGPVDIASPVDLALHLGVGVRNVVMLMADMGDMDRNTVAGRHGEVGESRSYSDPSSDDVIQTASLIV